MVVPPFLAILLNRCARRDVILNVLEDMKNEFRGPREKIWSLTHALKGARTIAEANEMRDELQRAGELMCPTKEWPALCPVRTLWKILVSGVGGAAIGAMTGDPLAGAAGAGSRFSVIDHETPEDVRRWFLNTMEKLWPVALGSISLRKSPCIRENCSACASGEGHSSYALSGYQGDRRFSVYVPDALAPEIQKAVEQGRRLQDLIKEAGIRYLHARKRAKRSTRK